MKIYLDTNVLRDCLKRRKLETIRLMELIRDKNIECVSSIFSVMELINNEKDDVFFNNHIKKGLEITQILRKRSQRDLNNDDFENIWDDINNMLASYTFIQFVNLIEVGWDMGLDVCKISNLDADDSIHLATAIGSECDILVTSDGFFKKEGNSLLGKHNSSAPENQVSLRIITPEQSLVEIAKKFPSDVSIKKQDDKPSTPK